MSNITDNQTELTEKQLGALSELETLICSELGGDNPVITDDQQARLWKWIGHLVDRNLTINGYTQEFEDDLVASMKENKDYCERCERGEVKCKCQVWNMKDMFSDKYLDTPSEYDNDDSNEGGTVFVENKDDGYIKCACSTTNYNFVNCNCKHLGLI